MDRLLPEDSVVAFGGGGLMAYFSRFPVVNLDCLASSRDCLRVRTEEAAAAFRRRRGVTARGTLAAGRERSDIMLFEGPAFSVRYRRTTREHRFKLWPEEWSREAWAGVDRAEWFWERMEPHLERQPDGAGLLVDGRLAQAFARDCAPDALAAWTWAGREGKAVVPWTRTSIGFCTSAVVLPHGALPPVRAATVAADVEVEGGFRRPWEGEIRLRFDRSSGRP